MEYGDQTARLVKAVQDRMSERNYRIEKQDDNLIKPYLWEKPMDEVNIHIHIIG